MKKPAFRWSVCLSIALPLLACVWSGCGRTPMLEPRCSLSVTPSSLDFGEVEAGKQADLSVTLSSGEGSVCHVSGLGLTPGSDGSFVMAGRASGALTLEAHEKATYHVVFKPNAVAIPLQRTGGLVISSDDDSRPAIEVPLAGQIHSDCRLAIMPTSIDFGRVALGDDATASVHVMNTGGSPCMIGQMALGPGSDPQFSVADATLPLAPGAEATIATSFRARDTAAPHHRTGQLTFATTDPKQSKPSIPMAADIVMCSLSVRPSKLEFGEVSPGSPVTMGLDFDVSTEGATCIISSINLRPDSDAGFSVDPDVPVGLGLAPGTHVTVDTTFAPTQVHVPLQRSGTLIVQSNDSLHPTLEIPLAARIRSECRLTVAPESVDFGQVMIDSSASKTVRIANTGKGPCEITGMALAQGSDRQFALDSREAETFALAAGDQHVVTLTFRASDPAEPHHRTGRLVLSSTDPDHETITVPLSADVDLGCVLSVTPTSVNFGSAILNTTANAKLTLSNQGTQPCQITNMTMRPGSDSGFGLNSSQPFSLVVPLAGKQTIDLRFEAADSSPPHEKHATLLIDSNARTTPQVAVPLSATIDTVCVEASRWIYTVDSNATFSRFDPTTHAFTDLGTLQCGTYASPFSMAVDQKSIAWVLYTDGRLYKVDTTTAKCEATNYQDPNFVEFGMGFVFDPATGKDTLYIAGGTYLRSGSCTLATISFPSLNVTTSLGPIKEGQPELTGTGDGSLWGFYPFEEYPTSHDAALVRLDPRNGAALATYHYPTITDVGGWAMKFWGGQFWIFVGHSIYAVDRDKPQTAKTIMTNTGRDIVGAGVSTCAPLKAN